MDVNPTMISEGDYVRLLKAVPEIGVKAGATGLVLFDVDYTGTEFADIGHVFEVEFHIDCSPEELCWFVHPDDLESIDMDKA